MAHDVYILMGSKSDMGHVSKITDGLDALGLSYRLNIASAHKTPQRLLEVIAEIEAVPEPKVYISVAGRSNALSGMLDATVVAPVIACPPPSDSFGGADIFSSLRMPSGVAPAVVLDPGNAALFAAKVLGRKEAVAKLQEANRQKLYDANAEL